MLAYGMVGGAVFDDVNHSGAIDAGDEGIGGVAVFVDVRQVRSVIDAGAAGVAAVEDARAAAAVGDGRVPDGAVDARGKVLVKLNVDGERLAAVVELLPAMRAPTVSELAETGFFAVETVVPKSTINTLIPRLKRLGAEDILELPVTKIVP